MHGGGGVKFCHFIINIFIRKVIFNFIIHDCDHYSLKVWYVFGIPLIPLQADQPEH